MTEREWGPQDRRKMGVGAGYRTGCCCAHRHSSTRVEEISDSTRSTQVTCLSCLPNHISVLPAHALCSIFSP